MLKKLRADDDESEGISNKDKAILIIYGMLIILVPVLVSIKLYRSSTKDLMEQNSIDKIGVLTQGMNLKS